MLPGTPHEARWVRCEPRRTLPRKRWIGMVHTAFPRCRVTGIQPLGDGLRNANFKLRLEGQPSRVVLRIYEQRCLAVPQGIGPASAGRQLGTVPEVIHAEPHGLEDLPPFTLARYVEGSVSTT